MATATKMTATEFKAWASDIANQLTRQTKDNWTTEYPLDWEWNHCVNFLRNGKARLWVKPGWDKPGMFTIFTAMDREENSPSNREYEYNKVRKELATSINCSVNKLPSKIASDIVKRILPNSLALVAAAAIDREAEAKRIVYATTEMSKLVDAIGQAGELCKNSSGNAYLVLRINGGYGSVEPQFYSDGNGSVEIKLRSLDVETAIAVCKLLNQFARKS